MYLKIALAAFVFLEMITGILNSESPAEAVVWTIGGLAGLIGAVTLGKSVKEVRQELQSKW